MSEHELLEKNVRYAVRPAIKPISSGSILYRRAPQKPVVANKSTVLKARPPSLQKPVPQAAPNAASMAGSNAASMAALRARQPSLQKSVTQAAARQPAPDMQVNGAIPSSIVSASLFQTSIFPVLIIDKNLKIVYANPTSRKFFTGFLKLTTNYFFDIFAKYFTIDDVKSIREAMLQGKNGYNWRGQAQIKSREYPTVWTRVYIFPAGINVKNPTEFTVMFDDVTKENRMILRGLFSSLLEASKLKDNDTGKHIERVNYYSEAIARELYNKSEYPAVDAEFIGNIGFLAAMHDVGKIGTPDDILNKQGPLSEFEWSIMKEHTKNGAFILEAYPNPMAKEIALSHHEKWDGKGYPFQLEGSMIPLPARIVSIADVYDALRSRRSYKEGFTHEVAIQKMIETRGTQFDPHLLDIAMKISGQFNDIFERNKDKK
ncbi:MAG: HD domain-containing protein [Spirochaetaceae bacterium]|jgi:putative two-component system response regulator|nr:HD domain-containing protein [Spirochaetaceae bacterium]